MTLLPRLGHLLRALLLGKTVHQLTVDLDEQAREAREVASLQQATHGYLSDLAAQRRERAWGSREP